MFIDTTDKKPNAQDVKVCKNINRKFGPNYYLATQFFPQTIKEAVWCVYAFVRVSDEIVDNPTSDRPIIELGNWANDWIAAYDGQAVESPVLRAAAAVWHRYDIPFSYSEDFLAAMAQDLEQDSYQTLNDVQNYMYGSASVIGLIMSHIIGYTGGQDTLRGAQLLGDAMQMSNFLRDVREDIELRDRIYLATDDMAKFGVSADDLKRLEMTPQIRALIKYYVEMTYTWYEESVPYINNLSHSSRLPVRMAAELYENILTKIEERNYDVFDTPRAGMSKLEKAKMVREISFYNFKYDHL